MSEIKLPIDESLPAYVNESIVTLEELVRSDHFSAFEKLARLSKGEILVLKILLLQGGTTTPTEISEAMNSTKGRVSAVLNALEKKGEVTRAIDKDNRRNIIVTLTDSGREHVMNELQSGYRTMTHIFEELGEQDSGEFIRMLTKVFKLMNETD